MCRIFFFFKQKTAYEMRISDWSSDVCSSDLPSALAPQGPADTSTIAHDAGHGFAYLPLEHRPPRDERELARFLEQRLASTGHFDHAAKPALDPLSGTRLRERHASVLRRLAGGGQPFAALESPPTVFQIARTSSSVP